jgi:hypothetical protein
MKFLGSILNFVFEIFFGCRHNHLTRTFTLQQETYKVCLDCGKQIYYSPETMRPLSVREVSRLRAAQLGEMKVVPANSKVTAIDSKERGSNAAA